MLKTKTWFGGGIHPHDSKHYTKSLPIQNADIPARAVIPIIQHIGGPAEICVEIGQVVAECDIIAKATGYVSTNIHASIPGKVVEIRDIYVYNGLKSQAVVIEMSGEFNKSGKVLENIDWLSLTKKEMLDKIQEKGVVGLGGATFPTHVKLNVPEEKKIDTLIINGAECEPFLTCDYRLMLDKAEELLLGVSIIQKILEVENVVVGIENNKMDCIQKLSALCLEQYAFQIVPLKVKYPQGDEKQLIRSILNRNVPDGGLPMDIGVVVCNIGTVLAVKEAIVNNKSLIDRVVTISGSGIKSPKNLKAKIGTPISVLIDECGGLKDETEKIIVGGPMMGFTQMDTSCPVTKGCSGILAFTKKELRIYKSKAVCISCGRCINACPFGLEPTRLFKFVENKLYQEAQDHYLKSCKECGCCSYVCPARIPLVQYMRLGKAMLPR